MNKAELMISFWTMVGGSGEIKNSLRSAYIMKVIQLNRGMLQYIIKVFVHIRYDRYKGDNPTFKFFQLSYHVQILASDNDFP